MYILYSYKYMCMYMCVCALVSVEEILSYGVRKRYAPNKQLSSSAKILADIGRAFPVAAATYDKCYGSKVHTFVSNSTTKLPPGCINIKTPLHLASSSIAHIFIIT